MPMKLLKRLEQLKTEGKILDFGLSNFTPSQTDLIRQKTESKLQSNSVFGNHFEAMLDGSLDYMQFHNIRPMAWNPLGTVFREDIEQTRRLKKF
jgi:predicted oxidoreductase